MDCPQHETTLAWLYGEAEESHLEHVGRCSACRSLVASHESALALAAGSMAANAPVANRRSRWPMFALVAVVLLVLGGLASRSWGPPSGTPITPRPTGPVFASVERVEPIDKGLDDLDTELSDLLADLEAL